MKYRLSTSVLCLFILVSVSVSSVLAADTCPELVKRALTTVGEACAGLGRNEACYGNNRLEAQLDLSSGQPFLKPADRTPVESIRSLQTFALDEANGTWGVAFLQIQANLPETLPGQNVKFILYGDVKLENAATNLDDPFGPMQAFYFVSGLQPNCKEAPPSSLLIQSPKGYSVTLRANGLDLKVGSSVALTAQKNKQMRLTTLEGEVSATYDGKTQIIPQGFETALELGGEDGLTPQGAPETAYLMDDEQWQSLAEFTADITDEPLELLDTDQYAGIDDYCADPLNADMCADPSLSDSLNFEACPEAVCPPLADAEAIRSDPTAVCGDGVCAVGEDETACAADCGAAGEETIAPVDSGESGGGTGGDGG